MNVRELAFTTHTIVMWEDTQSVAQRLAVRSVQSVAHWIGSTSRTEQTIQCWQHDHMIGVVKHGHMVCVVSMLT